MTPLRARPIALSSAKSSIDVTSADVLAELLQALRAMDIEFRFAEMKDPVKDKLKRFEMFEDFGAASFHPTLGAAVDDYLHTHAVDWKP